MPREHDVDRGAREQPVGEHRETAFGARHTEALKERTGAEHVEVRRIEVVVLEECGAVLSFTDPAIVEPVETLLVERDRSVEARYPVFHVLKTTAHRNQCRD